MSKRPHYLSIFVMSIMLMIISSCATGYNKHADQYFEEGLLFYERMEYDNSIESFDRVLDLAPYGKDNDVVYFNRGMAHFKSLHFDKAVYDFTRALEITSRNEKELRFDILASRGKAYQEINEYDLAIKDYSEAIQMIPEHEDTKFIYCNRAWIWVAKGNYNNAVDDFSEAIAIDPLLDEAFYGRASAWFKKEDLQRALIDGKEALRLVPSNKKYDDLLYKIKSSMNKE